MDKKLKPCPFCGGEVIEVNSSWNIANAECTKCGENWGYCGSQCKTKIQIFNKRTKEDK